MTRCPHCGRVDPDLVARGYCRHCDEDPATAAAPAAPPPEEGKRPTSPPPRILLPALLSVAVAAALLVWWGWGGGPRRPSQPPIAGEPDDLAAVSTLSHPARDGTVRAVEFLDDGRLASVCSGSSAITTWELAGGAKVGALGRDDPDDLRARDVEARLNGILAVRKAARQAAAALAARPAALEILGGWAAAAAPPLRGGRPPWRITVPVSHAAFGHTGGRLFAFYSDHRTIRTEDAFVIASSAWSGAERPLVGQHGREEYAFSGIWLSEGGVLVRRAGGGLHIRHGEAPFRPLDIPNPSCLPLALFARGQRALIASAAGKVGVWAIERAGERLAARELVVLEGLKWEGVHFWPRPDDVDGPPPLDDEGDIAGERFRYHRGRQVIDDATTAVAFSAGDTYFTKAPALTPDGRLLLARTADDRAALWDTTSGNRLRVFDGPRGVWLAAISPDGKRLLADAPGSLALYDAEDGRLLRRLTLPEGPVTALAFSPDGRRAAVGSGDTIRVWDLP